MEIALLNDFPAVATLFMRSLMVTAVQLVAFLAVFVIVGFLVDRMERKRNGWIRKTMGVKGIYLTALIGVPVHEMGHVLMCWLFGHKVDQLQLVQFGDPDGTMGYVNHSYDPHNLFHRIGLFFIGIAPIAMGIAVISGILFLFLPETFHLWLDAIRNAEHLSDIGGTVWVLLSGLFVVENLTSPWFYLFLVLAVSIASHMSLSQADIIGAKSGFITLYVVAAILNTLFLASVGGADYGLTDMFLSTYNIFMLSVSVIALLFAGLASLIAYLLYRLKIAIAVG